MADVAPKKKSDDGIVPVLLVLAVLFFARGGKLPSVIPSTTQAQAATYVYEKDNGEPSPGVMKGLDRLNREKKILATVFEDDSTNGLGQVPAQYRTAVEAARTVNGPALVVTGAEGKVLKVVNAPTTEAQVWEAVP